MTNRDPGLSHAVADIYTLQTRVDSLSSSISALQTQTIRSISGSTYELSAFDIGSLMAINTSSGSVSITLNNFAGLVAGQKIDFIWLGAATSVSFSPSSVTFHSVSENRRLRERYSAATLICVASDSYVLVGDISA